MNRNVSCLFTLIFLTFEPVGGVAQDLNVSVLREIGAFAENFCGQYQTSSESERINASGKFKADLKGFLERLADLDLDVSASIDTESLGILQKDLPTILQNTQECKLRIWEDLKSAVLKAAAAESESPFETLTWARDLEEMVGSSEGSVPVVYKDIVAAWQKNSRIKFKDLTCDVMLWVDSIHVPDRPTGIGGVRLGNNYVPDDAIQVPPGSVSYAFNFNSRFVGLAFNRQRSLAREHGDDDFAHALTIYKNSSLENISIKLAISAPSDDCSGAISLEYDIGEPDFTVDRGLE